MVPRPLLWCRLCGLAALLLDGARGYGRSPPHARAAARTATALGAGLRDLVGPYDDPGGGGFGRRDSPGFVGFAPPGPRDRNYPDYDVVLDAPARGRRGGGGGPARLFDGVPYEDLPSEGGGPYDRGPFEPSRPDPYERGRRSDFVDTNGGARRGRGPRDTIDVRSGPASLPPPRPLLGGGRSLPGRRSAGGPPPARRRDYGPPDGPDPSLPPRDPLGAVERYFDAWNLRDVPRALACFDDAVYYDDTQFSSPFDGKAALADHLLYVADSLPDSFYVVVDELSATPGATNGPAGGRERAGSPTFQLGRSRAARAAGYGAPTASVAALWHVENELGPLPFARGCSFFKVDPRTNLIVEVYDFPEPAVIKTGSSGLNVLSLANKLVSEPKRWLPFFAWIVYVYVVYFSNGILPGKDILHADAKTWTEVQNLSFSFLFVAPATHLPTAAKLHPVLEGLFNGVLAWAFLFAGFLSDERSGRGPYERRRDRDPASRYYERMDQNREQALDNGMVLVPPVSLTKTNLLGLVPTIVGMQFFTCAFLLPYLFSRTSERYSSAGGPYARPVAGGPRRIRPLYKEELDRPGLVLGEWRGLGILLGAVGLFAVYWGFAGRTEDFGPPIWVSDKRMVSFMKLLNQDRVAAALVVDLWVLGIFQGWLVDDDWKRRGRSLEEEKFLRNVAKFVPFFGLASYFVFRPQYPSSQETFDYEGFFDAREEEARRRGGRGRDDGFGDDDRFFDDRFRN